MEAGDALFGIGAISGLAGSIMQASAARSQARAAAAAAEYNAVRAEMEGHAEERRRRRLARRAISSQFTQMAGKTGVIAEEGGWLEALVQNAAEYEVNALNASIAARNTARLDRAHGANAIRQGNMQAGASLLSGINRTAGLALSLYGTPGKQTPLKVGPARQLPARGGPMVPDYSEYA